MRSEQRPPSSRCSNGRGAWKDAEEEEAAEERQLRKGSRQATKFGSFNTGQLGALFQWPDCH